MMKDRGGERQRKRKNGMVKDTRRAESLSVKDRDRDMMKKRERW